MKKFLLIVLSLVPVSALAQGLQPLRLKETIADFPRSLLQLKTNGPVSLDVNQGEQAAYKQLAEIAGLNIVFDPDFRNSANAPFRIENADVLQAFDLLSVRAGSFVEIFNSNTIIVSQDNQQKRRDYEPMVLKTFYLPNGASPLRLTETITTLRTTLNARYLAQSTTASAVVMRDTPTRVAAAEKIVGASMPLVAGASVASRSETVADGHILTLENGVVKDSAPDRSILTVSGSGPISLDVTESTRALFQRLSELAGLNVLFDPDFRSLDGFSFKVDRLNILDAIQVLGLQTRCFFVPVDAKTIMVAPDNQAKRRDFENVSAKTFYLANASHVELVEIITALRTLLNARYLGLISDSNAIVMRDSPNRLALAERIVSDMRKSGSVVSSPGFPTGSEAGFVLNRRAAITIGVLSLPLQPKVKGPFSFDVNGTVTTVAAYETVAAMAGLSIIFDSRLQDSTATPFKVEHVDIVDALDFLSLQTRTIWQMMGADTVLVAPDTPTARADLLPKITKTINLAPIPGTSGNITEIVTTLRVLFNLRQISVLDNSIVMTDTAENVAFSEKLVKDLQSPPSR
jgi:type II secretory pathway component GspD/PulD (secretin)